MARNSNRPTKENVEHALTFLRKYLKPGMDVYTNVVHVASSGMTIYELSGRLWPKGTKRPHGQRNGEPDRSGGYALRHRRL